MKNKVLYLVFGLVFFIFFIGGILLTKNNTSVSNLFTSLSGRAPSIQKTGISALSSVSGSSVTVSDESSVQSIFDVRKSPTDQLAQVTSLQVELTDKNPQTYRTYYGSELASAGSYEINGSKLHIKIYLSDSLLKDNSNQKNIEFSIKFLQILAAASSGLDTQKPAGEPVNSTEKAVDSLKRVYLDMKEDGTITKSLFTIK